MFPQGSKSQGQGQKVVNNVPCREQMLRLGQKSADRRSNRQKDRQVDRQS